MSLLRKLVGRWGGGVDEVDDVRIDSATAALIGINAPHRHTHEGTRFDYTESVDQAINVVFDIQFTTPDSDVLAHLTINFDAENETEFFFYENVNIILGGTAFTPLNHNRPSTNASVTVVKYISNTDVANANADTAVAGANTLIHSMVGSGRQLGGGRDAREEWILKPNEDYCLRFIATVAGWISFHLDWYEHEDLH